MKKKTKVKVNEARIFAMRRKGRTLKEIGDAIGVSDGVVRARLFSSGKFPGRVPLRNRFPKETARVIFSMYKKGASLCDIGAVVGYSHETVRTVLRKSGRVVRRRSQPKT
jgi:lambda repressor-like predicted transcriptional regulator